MRNIDVFLSLESGCHGESSVLQVVRLTDEPFSSAKGVKSPLTSERVVEWLVGR